jgi:hypothetical protein
MNDTKLFKSKRTKSHGYTVEQLNADVEMVLRLMAEVEPEQGLEGWGVYDDE